MRLTKSFAIAASALALATGAAFAGEAPLTNESDPMGYQPSAYSSYEQADPQLLSEAESSMNESIQSPEYSAQPQQYEVYDVYVVPAEIVLIPIDSPSEVPVAGNELG